MAADWILSQVSKKTGLWFLCVKAQWPWIWLWFSVGLWFLNWPWFPFCLHVLPPCSELFYDLSFSLSKQIKGELQIYIRYVVTQSTETLYRYHDHYFFQLSVTNASSRHMETQIWCPGSTSSYYKGFGTVCKKVAITLAHWIYLLRIIIIQCRSKPSLAWSRCTASGWHVSHTAWASWWEWQETRCYWGWWGRVSWRRVIDCPFALIFIINLWLI